MSGKIDPPGEIDLPRVRRIAQLARLELTDDEARLLAGQLGTILDYFKQLDAVDTAGVQPLYHPHCEPGVPRDDIPQPGLTPAEALSNAPQRHNDFFAVPRVLRQDEQ